MADPVQIPAGGKRAAIGAAIGAAVLLAAPLAERWEGYRSMAYFDPAKILTVCYGETENVDPAKVYSQGQCAAKLRTRMERDYAPPIAACVPSMAEPANRHAFAALIDASYNAGPAAVCRSPMARHFNAGRYAAGCDAFAGWYTSALNRKTGVRTVFPGLVKRRLAERDLCRMGAVA